MASESTQAIRKATKAAKHDTKDEKRRKALAKQTGVSPGLTKEAKKEKVDDEVAILVSARRSTPQGQKPDFSGPMPKVYDPKLVEAATYSWWEESGCFRPREGSSETFSIVMPPPNVTGSLHLGHALTLAIEDTVVRWHRMSGRSTLWVPGTDHAGIATQTAVEKSLARKGVSRSDLGRDRFQTECESWIDLHGERINDQIRRLGASPDWSRAAFTLDPALCAAVQEAFVSLHESGLVYRHSRLVNWDCYLGTAVSDIEVDFVDVAAESKLDVPGYDRPVEFGVLTSFAYRLADDMSREIVVATTRPETMLADTAVAVHPDDPRYTDFHGASVRHPLDDRLLPIICDTELVDMAFGTGVVKISPAHDQADYAAAQRHQLTVIDLLTDEGAINEAGGRFSGLPRFQAREAVVTWLRELGLWRGREGHTMRLGICSRSGDIVEPVLKPQWYVSCASMAAAACEAVRDGRLEILPSGSEMTWFRWLESSRDWCVSRQLWFGHRIPAYYVTLHGDAAGERLDRWIIARSLTEAQQQADALFPGEAPRLQQDDDVLDTWFSSALFPFSTLGWPAETADLQRFYPTTLLETGSDILFFWVARMVMLGMQLTGEVPFRRVYLHGMVRDAHGRKMSKSLGNVIDPLAVVDGISLDALHQTLLAGNLDPKEIAKARAGQKADFPTGIRECGADALRFALLAYTMQANSINLDVLRVLGYRHWCNKLWNAVRFAASYLNADFEPATLDASSVPWPCQWILSRLENACAQIDVALRQCSFSTAVTAIYDWWQHQLCDVFIELAKRAGVDRLVYGQTLWTCLDMGLRRASGSNPLRLLKGHIETRLVCRLLHPFMPYVTEELWQRLPAWHRADIEHDMAYILRVVAKLRGLRTGLGLVPKQRPPVSVVCTDTTRRQAVVQATGYIATLVPAESVVVLPMSPGIGQASVVVDDDTTAFLHIK